jgi:hypothetical protein
MDFGLVEVGEGLDSLPVRECKGRGSVRTDVWRRREW